MTTPRQCSTPGCREHENLQHIPGADGWTCAACSAEIALLTEQVRKEALERDAEIARRRID